MKTKTDFFNTIGRFLPVAKGISRPIEDGQAKAQNLDDSYWPINVQPAGRLRAGLFQALERQGLRRELAISVTHFLAAPEIIAVTDYCATLPRLICNQLAKDPRLKVVEAPVDLGTFAVEMAWQVRYRNDPAHQWFRQLLVETASELSGLSSTQNGHQTYRST
jgi:DNA-binding transcriptional LysR family regulator